MRFLVFGSLCFLCFGNLYAKEMEVHLHYDYPGSYIVQENSNDILVNELIFEVICARLKENASQQGSTLSYFYRIQNQSNEKRELLSLLLNAQEEEMPECLGQLLLEIENVKNFGVSNEELVRAKKHLNFETIGIEEISTWRDKIAYASSPWIEAYGFNPFIKEKVLQIVPERKREKFCLAPAIAANVKPFYIDNITPTIVSIAEYVQEDFEPFYQLRLTQADQQNIYKLIKTMGDESLYKLLMKKKKMEKLGDKVNPIHPLRFLGYIFSHPTLPSSMRAMAKSSFKWRKYINGLSKRAHQENHQNNLDRHVPGFCNETKENPDTIRSFLARKDYEGMVKYLMYH